MEESASNSPGPHNPELLGCTDELSQKNPKSMKVRNQRTLVSPNPVVEENTKKHEECTTNKGGCLPGFGSWRLRLAKFFISLGLRKPETPEHTNDKALKAQHLAIQSII
ncbi:hypothetical protein SUGI_0834240 [Cryptomeria japonica]|nr:hypothetical protein SUGI_0834240 [Cryptomeria japonica]